MKRQPRKSDKKEPSLPPSPVKKEIHGIFWLLATVILGGSLISFQPSDPLFWTVAGTAEKSHNLFGTVGTHLAGAAFLLLGFSSFWLAVATLAAAFISFRGIRLTAPVRRTIFGVLLLVSSSALLSLKFPETINYKNGDILAGGLVGIHVAFFLKDLLNQFGSYVLLGVCFVISFMMVTGISLGAVFSKIAACIYSSIYLPIWEQVVKHRERKRRAKKTTVAHKRIKSMPKVKIIEPKIEKASPPEQERFPFMQVQGNFTLPGLDLLADPPPRADLSVQRESLEMNARRVERKLNDFGVQGEVVEILPGPVITMYEFKPAPGVKISKVAGLADDLALTLRAQSIRIVAPIPGKAAIGIEIPNSRREMVFLKDILSSPAFRETKSKLPIALGKDITGGPVVADLARMPHLLVAGATGAGKSVSINTMIHSLVFKASPEIVRFLMVDPKRIELSEYQGIPHLLHPVVTQPKEATKALKWAVREMERRYMLLSEAGVRNIDNYNRKIAKSPPPAAEDDENAPVHSHLPYIILIIDELADLMMVSSREVEESIIRLAQMARAAGIHLIVATQRPSVDVLTGIIKANFPARISFQVSSKVDSRTILDAVGAEHLLGEGDMLFMPPGVGRITRIHGAFVSEEDIKSVCDFLKSQKEPEYDETVLSDIENAGAPGIDADEIDEKIDEAIDIVIKTGQASISMLQRRLRVGYNRAARMIEYMEQEGIVGPSDGVRPREVYGRKDSL
ncbi:MAG: DNA translocase FtsK 4TM domain-containing protein [Desulfatiglandaceae bacterium]